jgi:hypothetical protein
MRFAHSPLALAIFSVLCPIAYANDAENAAVQPEVKLNTIIVEAEKANEVGQTTYSKEDLEKTPNTQKTLSEFLKVNPNIQFSNKNNNAASQAEINAADMSIHGALPYNNSFLLNGMSFNNDINPYSGTSSLNNISDLDGTSQAVTINTDLLCNLEVLDSNVSAKYGKFTGGVISATTCAPKTVVGEIHGSVNYDYTNSNWNRFNYIDTDEEAEFNDPTKANAQKNYTKQGFSLYTYGRLTENFGLNFGLSQRTADIKAASQLKDGRPYNEEREVDNASLDMFYDPSEDLSFKLGLQHANDQKLRFVSNALSDGIHQSSDSNAINLNIDKKFNSVTLKQNLSYQEKQNDRISSSNDQYSWLTSEDKNWGTSTTATEGVSGTILSKQKTLEYNTHAEFNPLQFLNTAHQFNIGAGFSHNEAQWQRPNDFTAYFVPSKFGTDCIKNDGTVADACDPSYIPSKGSSGQYSIKKTVHTSGQLDVQQDSWFAYAEDRVNWKNTLEAVIGLRYDYDSLSKNHNLAPRTAFHYMPFTDPRLKLSTGWSRYYDRYLFNFDLQDGINSLKQNYTRTNINSDWISSANTSSINVKRSDLNLPYADEWLIGLSAELNNLRMQMKYVNRQYKDQYYLARPDATDLWTRIYTNNKEYNSEDITFTLGNIAPIEALNAKHRVNFAFNYTDTQRDYNDADEVELKEYSHVLYKGKITATNDIPASDYNVPITARLSWDFTPNRLEGLNISNFLVYKPRHNGLIKSSIPTKDQIQYNDLPIIYSYDDTDVPSVVRWDMRASYTHKFSKDYSGMFGLTMNNVTNRHNKYLDNDYYLKSEIGRQIVADVTFKF